jgi:hypothetical protein
MKTALAVLVLSAAASAQTITFENVPGVIGEAPEGLLILDQFDAAPHWVSFERVDPVRGLQPAVLARVGAPRTAFHGQARDGCDGLRTEEDIPNRSVPFAAGCFYLTDDGFAGSRAPEIQPLLLRYSVPVLQAQGYILDIDNEEEFVVHARDENGVDVVAPIVLTPRSGSGGNGDASLWAFDVDEPIHSILIDYTGKGDSRGLGLDEFSPATLCPEQVIHHGNGVPGSGNRIPALSVSCPRVGQAGTIEVFNGAGGAHGCIALGFRPGTQPFRCGGTILGSAMFMFVHTLSGRAGVPGEGRVSQPYAPLPLALAGMTFYVQAGYIDGGAPCRGFSLTEIVEATIR